MSSGSLIAGRGPLLVRIAPGLRRLREYSPAWLRQDLIAGITLAAYLLPAALGDASLANLPPQAGLYACLFAGLVFWPFCSSRQTAVTVTSAISLLVGVSLGGLAGSDAMRFWALASATALIAGLLALLTWLVGAGVIINFVSETVLIGFKCGIALVLISTQLPKLFGFSAGHSGFWHNSFYFFSHLHQTNPTALLLGALMLGILILGKIFLPTRPVALFVVIAGILASSLLNLSEQGVKMLGAVPQGLPPIALPSIHPDDINDLLPLAVACFLLGAVESSAIGRTFARKHGYRFDPNQELLALAASNIASGLGQGFPVSGGMSQSLVNDSSGAKTPLSNLFSSLIVLVMALWCAALLKNLPQPVLAAVVLVAVAGLIKLSALKHLWRFSRSELLIALVALAGVLASGILRGVLIGALLSLVLLLRRVSRPQAAELGRLPGSDTFADLSREPQAIRDPEVLVLRTEASLCYFNAEHVYDRFFAILARRDPGVRLVVLHLGTTPMIDLAGAELLEQIHHGLRKHGIDLRLAEAHGQVREALHLAGFEEACGPVRANLSVHLAITQWREGRPRS